MRKGRQERSEKRKKGNNKQGKERKKDAGEQKSCERRTVGAAACSRWAGLIVITERTACLMEHMELITVRV